MTSFSFCTSVYIGVTVSTIFHVVPQYFPHVTKMRKAGTTGVHERLPSEMYSMMSVVVEVVIWGLVPQVNLFFVMKFQTYGALQQDTYICMNMYMFMYDVGHS